MPHATPPSSAAARAPVPAAGHCWPPVPLQETPSHAQAGLAQSLWGLWVLVCTRFCLSPPSISDGNGFHSKCDFIPPTNLLGLLFCPWTGVSFGRIHYSPVDGVQWLVAILEFLQEKVNTRPSTPPFRSSTQYVNKFGKLSSGHSTGKGQFSFQSLRKAIPNNTQTTAQLHSPHTLVK